MQSRHFVYPILHQLTNPSLNKLKLYTEGAAQMNVKIKKKLKKTHHVLSREEVIKRTITSGGGSKLGARRRGSKDMLLLVMILTKNCHIPTEIHGQEREINV